MRCSIVITLLAICTLGQVASAQKKAGESLEQAYKREFAFLEAEKRALTERLKNEKASAQKRIQAAEGEIRALQSRVVGSASEAERINEHLLTAERDIESLEEQGDILSDVLVRAQTVFSNADKTLPEANTEERAALLGQLNYIFGESPKLLGELGQTRQVQGSYFDVNGNEIKGTILYVGGVASFGLAPQASGPLSPAGQNKLKLWPTPNGAAAAQALAQGSSQPSLPIFLYKNLDKPIEPKVEKTWKDTVNTGGVIGWVIVALGLCALIMIIIRALVLWKTSGGSKALTPILSRLREGKRDEAIALAQKSRNATGRVVTSVLNNLDAKREQVEDVVAEALLNEQPLLSRFGSAIVIVAAVSPLLGLLGTVTGMISTFDIITDFGTGNPKLLSGGISEALVTTELGLIVAIPALLLGNMLTGWSEKIRDSLDASALATVNCASGMRRVGEAFKAKSTSNTSVAEASA